MRAADDTVWRFDQGPEVAALTTRQVLEMKLPVLMVTHYSDDHSWAFVCGTTEDYLEDGRVVCMSHILNLDRSLVEIADLPPGWSAERKDLGSEWIRFPDDAA
jgi:hypothetical protein